MPFSIVRNDLANYNADAVVVSANEKLIIDGGNGYDLALKVGFDRMQHACDAIGGCSAGNAVSIETDDIRKPLIIFAVGPVWIDGDHDEPAILRNTIANALHEAMLHDAHTLAMPLIATGAFGFPPDLAFRITTKTIKTFLQTHDMDITLVLFGREAVKAGIDYGEIKQFIDDNYVESHPHIRNLPSSQVRFDPVTGEPLGTATVKMPASYASSTPPAAPAASRPPIRSKHPKKTKKTGKKRFFKRRRPKEEAATIEGFGVSQIETDVLEDASSEAQPQIRNSMPAAPSPAPTTWQEFQHQDDDLQSWLGRKHDTFTTTLFKLIDTRGMSDSEVYKRANMSRQLFSKIRSDDNYRPKKKTVLALAVALELDLAETIELLNCAGFSLSQSSQFDLIIEYFIRKNVYDCFTINEALFAFGEELLS